MDDALAVRLVECVGDLGRYRQRLVDWQRPLFEARRQCLTFQKGHDEEERPVRVANVEDAADVRVVERRDRAGLALEPCTPIRVRERSGAPES